MFQDNVSLESIRELYDKGNKEILVRYSNNETEKMRLFISPDDDLCYFKKGARRWGYRVSSALYRIESVEPINKVKKSSDAETWKSGWFGVAERLNKSGLFLHYRAELDLALSLGYEKMQELYRLYQKSYSRRDDAEDLEIVRSYSPDLVGTREDGSEYIDWAIIWTFYIPPKVKKMRFYNGSPELNAHILDEIKSHMELRLPYTAGGRTSYDISFSYDPERNEAFYSEEYRGMGNGHYYLVLDATHAVFYEDD